MTTVSFHVPTQSYRLWINGLLVIEIPKADLPNEMRWKMAIDIYQNLRVNPNQSN